MGKTLLKGMQLLERLGASREPMSITELAEDLDLMQSNVHRLLQSLIQAGYVRQDPVTRRYRCTMRLWELGLRISDQLDLPGIAQPHMQALVQESRETVQLGILDGTDVIYIYKIDSPQPIRSYTRVGSRAPAYCTGTGKVLLAHCENLEAALPPKLIKHTPKTITTLAALKRELLHVREQGIAENISEWREDVYGMGAPLYDATGHVTASVGVSGLASRMEGSNAKRIRTLLKQTARDISRDLGYRG